jgi:hypothetical protein
MADYSSSLPARTESAGDIDVFISDATTSSQKLKVNADGSIDTNTSLPSGTAVEITDGSDTLAVNADGSINAAVTATDLDIRALTNADVVTVEDGGGSLTVDGTVAATQSGTWNIGTVASITNDVNIADGGNSITVDAVDLDIRDLTATDVVSVNLRDDGGTAFSATNPLAVTMVSDQLGDEVVDFNTSASVAKDASVNHDYTVTAAKTFLGQNVWVSGSGKLKAQVLVDGAIVFVAFNSTSNPNIDIPMDKIVKAGATEVVRITLTNRDNQAQDLYSTLTGIEV